MKDEFGREISMLRLSVTERCGYHCIYCDANRQPCAANELGAEELLRIARAAIACGVRKIRLTGGEPLERADILTICEQIARMDGLRELCITTNGMRMAKMARPLREAGVSAVNLSLDTLREERFAAITGGGRLQDVLQGLQAALAAGFAQVKTNTVLLGCVNEDEIDDFVALTRQNPLDVRFIELMPMGACAEWPADHFLEAAAVLRACPALVPVDVQGVSERFRLPDAMGTVGLIRPMSHRFCGSCNRIRVTADGMLKPCLHSTQEIPLKGLSDEQLVAELQRGIRCKAERHHLETGRSDTGRTMREIGG